LPPLPESSEIDAVVSDLMMVEQVPGLALAIIDAGKIHTVKTFGLREVKSQTALEIDTVMYGASLTKFVFATYVMQLVEEGRIDLDHSIADQLPKPLPEYEDYADLADDERWRELTLRVLLSHTTGFPNYRFFPPEGGFDPEGRLRLFFDPGERYGYSGEGYYIAQLVVEEALGVKAGVEIQRRIFDPLGMNRTGLVWREDFAPNVATGYSADGEALGHNRQSNARAAGSMDTTIEDVAAFAAAFMRGEIVSTDARDELLRPLTPITSQYQFPTLDNEIDPRNQDVRLAAGLGVVTWSGPQGPGFFKGGHNEKTDNILVCLSAGQRCVIILSNIPKGDRVLPQIVDTILGDTEIPWRWEYSSLDSQH
jgi:CubicO group peptidase (beta-lactamase class C family)